MVRLLPLLVLGALAACASDRASRPAPSATGTATANHPAPATEPGSNLPPLVSRSGELAIQLASQIGPGKSCGDVATSLERFVEAHRSELGPSTAAVIAWEKTASRDDLKTYYRKVFPAIEVRIDAGARCEKHAGARLAFERFFAATGLD
jgi:hypothetical protein